MAILQDKRKLVSIYDQESPAAQVQSKMTEVATAPLRFAGRQLNDVTAPAQRIAEKTVVPMVDAIGGAAAAVGNRLASDAANTADVAQRVGLRQTIQQTPQGDMAGFRGAEADNQPAPPPAPRLGGSAAVAGPTPSPAPTPTVATAPRLGGSAAITTGTPAFAGRSLDIRPSVNQIPGSGMIRNEQTGETVAMAPGGKIGSFDAEGRPIANATPLRLGGRSAPGGGSSYSFEGSADAAQRFNSAVSTGEYSPEAVAARKLQGEQFDERQGRTKLTPVEQMVGRSIDSFKPEQRPGVITSGLNAIAAKDANKVAMINAGVDAEGKTLHNRLTLNSLAKQQMIDEAEAELETASPARKKFLEDRLVRLGARQPREQMKPVVQFEEGVDEKGEKFKRPFVFDPATGEARALRIGGQAPRVEAPPEAIAALKKNKALSQQFMDKYGYLPTGA